MSLRQIPAARLLSKDKVVESPLLNQLAAQPLREVAARCVYRLTRWDDPPEGAAMIDELRREGMLLVPEFLPPARFEALREECARLLDAPPTNVLTPGPNRLEIHDAVAPGPTALPEVHRFLADPRLKALFEGAEKREISMGTGTRYVERLIQGPGDTLDPETVLHIDTYFNTHKAWLYLTDVALENGPFVFVRRSHQLRMARLYYDYRGSVERERNVPGSRRVTREEHTVRDLRETVVTCPKNTLVVANTFGYHRRLRGKPGCVREAVHVSVRFNPFAPSRRLRGAQGASVA